jgi:hypothetical protein
MEKDDQDPDALVLTPEEIAEIADREAAWNAEALEYAKFMDEWYGPGYALEQRRQWRMRCKLRRLNKIVRK